MGATFRPTYADGRPLVRCICEDATCPACQLSLNLNERNWRDMLDYLGMDVTPGGRVAARKLAHLCELRLAMVEAEAAIPATDEPRRPGRCAVVNAGRSAGYLRMRAEELLRIARAAGDAFVSWG